MPGGAGGPGGMGGMAGMMAGMGMRGGPGGAGGPGMPGAPGGQGGPGAGGGGGAPSFRDPQSGAQSFLDAVKAKDLDKLSDSVAKRAKYQAPNDEQKDLFSAILDRTAGQEALDQLADLFSGMTVSGMNEAKSTGSRGVTVSKMDKNNEVRITITMRKEVDGWKVLGYSGKKTNYGMGNVNQRRRR